MNGKELQTFEFDEQESDCELCNDSGCDQCDPEHYMERHLKWLADGAETPLQAADMLQAFVDDLRQLAKDGWRFTQPVDNSHFWLFKAKENVTEDL